MADEQRSQIMRAVKSADTAPELIVRQQLTRLGFRYRLHRADLPGKPDIAFIGRRKVIFVHGCFWHGHACKRGNRTPVANRDYWVRKIDRNRTRDCQHLALLEKTGWQVLTVWECELKDLAALDARLRGFLA